MEYFFTCPYCWQEISILIDTSQSSQEYTEDCEVCCNPIRIRFDILDESVSAFSAEKTQ